RRFYASATFMAIIRRPRAILKVDRRITTQVVGLAKRMAKAFADRSDLFPSPAPPLVVFEAQIKRVDELEVLVGTGGLASGRDIQRDILMGMMDSERLYVQSLADAAGPDEGVALIKTAGLTVAGVTSYSKPVLTVRRGPLPGTVELDACA